MEVSPLRARPARPRRHEPWGRRARRAGVDLCGSLEAQREAHGLSAQPPDEWPISPAELGREFAWYTDFIQRASVSVVTVDPETARDMLAGEWSHDEPSDPRGENG